MQILRYADLVDVPWKNGGGTTRNIATGEFGGRNAWRISRADVGQDGPFSNFAGLVRILTVVSQGSMSLEHETGVIQAQPWRPVRFDGGLPVFARLTDGPLTDLNLMFDPALCTGEAKRHEGPMAHDLAPPAAGLCAIHVLGGSPRLSGTQLAVGDTAFADTAAQLTLAQGDAVLEITLMYLDQSAPITLCIADL